jgi:hypothetical protein
MTDYERLSLSLLSLMLSGLSLQLTQRAVRSDGHMAVAHTQSIIQWQEQVSAVKEATAAALLRAAGAGG